MKRKLIKLLFFHLTYIKNEERKKERKKEKVIVQICPSIMKHMNMNLEVISNVNLFILN